MLIQLRLTELEVKQLRAALQTLLNALDKAQKDNTIVGDPRVTERHM